jgi:hypothetical protein
MTGLGGSALAFPMPKAQPPQENALRLVLAAGKNTAPVEDAAKSLDNAAKTLEAGKAEQAVKQLSALLSSSRLEGSAMARALFLRGTAYQKLGRPAQAISDLTSALWLKGGLSEADRTVALARRAEAYREAGLNELADADSKTASRSASTAAPSQRVSNWQTSTATARADSAPQREAAASASAPNAQKQGAPASSLSGFFANLFGGGSSAATPRASAEPPAGNTVAIGTAWSTSTIESQSKAPKATRVAERRDADNAAPATRGASYRVQVAAVRRRQEAEAIVARLKKERIAEFENRSPEVDQTVIGNMGTFYRVVVGPYADADGARPLCARLRTMSLDCLIRAD